MAGSRVAEGSVVIAVDAIDNTTQLQQAGATRSIFYNPPQVVNRDVSLLAIKVYGAQRIADAFAAFAARKPRALVDRAMRGLVICEGLAASGLRSLRYARELPASFVQSITANDLCPAAAALCRSAAEANGVPRSLLAVANSDVNALLYRERFENGRAFDVVDLDPYGTVSPFLNSALQCIANRGLLCLTSTDMQVLAGNAPEVAFAKYGGSTIKKPFLHELSLRLVLHRVKSIAALYRRAVDPLLSLSLDFYVRLFVRVRDAPKDCASLLSETAVALCCVGCSYHRVVPFGEQKEVATKCERRKRTKFALAAGAPADAGAFRNVPTKLGAHDLRSTCPFCAAQLQLVGPFYSGPLHQPEFVERIGAEAEKAADAPAPSTAQNFARVERLFSEQSLVESAPDSLSWVFEAEKRFSADLEQHRFEHLHSHSLAHIRGVVNAIRDDLPDCPLHYDYAALSSEFKLNSLPLKHFLSALLWRGKRVGVFHRSPNSVKTDADFATIRLVFAAWAHVQATAAAGAGEKDAFGTVQLAGETVNFALHPSLDRPRRPRFVQHSEPNWGPGTKAGGKRAHEPE